MVLHLLGKKSWNVYNQDNIARVRRDEAEAAEREKEKSRLEQSREGERRIAVLRGQRPLSPGVAEGEERTEEDRGGDGRDREVREKLAKRSRRRIPGEDDTDRDIRVARERYDLEQKKEFKIRSSDVSLLDAEGHTNLFPVEGEKGQKVGKIETDGRVKTQEDGKHRDQKRTAPWYTSTAGDVNSGDIAMSKDVWGNEDPRRQERQQLRLHVDDPLQVMKKGVTQLREMERARKRIEAERREDLELLRFADDECSRTSRRRRRSASPERDGHSSRHRSRSNHNRHERHRHHRHRHHRHHHDDGNNSHHHRSHRHRPEG